MFDLIFIDGGHDIETAKSDLALAHSLSHSHTVVIMDDVLPSVYWGRGHPLLGQTQYAKVSWM